MDEFISRAEHEEFMRRLDAENDRQNKRLGILEATVDKIGNLTVSVERLAMSVQTMAGELKAQGDRIEKVEGRDGEKWRTVTSHILTAIVGAIVAWGLSRIGI